MDRGRAIADTPDRRTSDDTSGGGAPMNALLDRAKTFESPRDAQSPAGGSTAGSASVSPTSGVAKVVA